MALGTYGDDGLGFGEEDRLIAPHRDADGRGGHGQGYGLIVVSVLRRRGRGRSGDGLLGLALLIRQSDDQKHAANQESRDHDDECEIVLRQRRPGHHHDVAGGQEVGRHHRGVVHRRNGEAQGDRAACGFPRAPFAEGKPERERRDRHADQDRAGNAERRIGHDAGRADGAHAHIVHPRNAAAHQHAPGEHRIAGNMSRTGRVKAKARQHDGDKDGDRRDEAVIFDRDGEPQSEHGDEMHRPDAAADGHGSGDDLELVGRAGEGAAPGHDEKSGERPNDRHQDRENNQQRIV
jgi:hypothetical protein